MEPKRCGKPHSMYPEFRCFEYVDAKGHHLRSTMCNCGVPQPEHTYFHTTPKAEIVYFSKPGCQAGLDTIVSFA